ncbi:hypothetical protein C0431_13290 [bacterium]|nr:hypothetical protein [bacterium]
MLEQNMDHYQAPEEEGMSGITKAGIAAAAALGVAGLGYRTGSMARVGRLLAIEGRAARVAVQEAVERGGVRRPLGESIDTIQQVFRKEREKQAQMIGPMNWNKNTPENAFDMERLMRQRRQVVGERKKDGTWSGDVAYQVREQERLRILRERMRAQGVEGADEAIDFLAKIDSRRLRGADKDALNVHMKDINESTRELVRKGYQQIKGEKIELDDDKARETIEAAVKNAQKKVNESIVSQTKRPKIENVIRGGRMASVDDVLTAHDAKKIKLDQKLVDEMKELRKTDETFGDSVFDNSLLVRNGRFEDHRIFRNKTDEAIDWLSTTLPGRLTKLQDYYHKRKSSQRAAIRMFGSESVQPVLNAQMGKELNEGLGKAVLYTDGDFMDLVSGEILNNKKMYLASSQYGSAGKYVRHAAGLMTESKERNKFMEWFDLGIQDRDSSFYDMISTVTKFANKNWERNRVRNIFQGGVATKDDYRFLQDMANSSGERMSTNTMELIAKFSGSNLYDDVNFSDSAQRIMLFERIGEDLSEKASKGVVGINDDLLKAYRRYMQNPDEFMAQSRPVGQANPILGGQNQLIGGMERIDSLIATDAIRRMSRGVPGDSIDQNLKVFDMIDAWEKAGQISLDQAATARLYSAKNVLDANDPTKHLDKERIADLHSRMFDVNTDIGRRLNDSMYDQAARQFPIWAPHSSTVPENQIEDIYVGINRTEWSDMLSIGEISKQMVAGTKHMEDFSALTAYGAYMLPYRLQSALGSVGLGFSDASMQSGLHLWGNLMAKRVVPIVGGFSAYEYLDYNIERATGESLMDRYEIHRADQDIRAAQERESMGVDMEAMKRQRLLTPGADQWGEFPELTLPVVGEVGIGHALSELAGMAGNDVSIDERETMTEEEVREDLVSGTEAVRKGRWWLFGSSTPYAGDRIEYFAPNAYRRAVSDYEYTDVMYGDSNERWKNSWFPTFENPLGALGYVVGTADPYWFENMHYNDRPYLVSGGLFDPNMPFLGDVGNMTIGALIKPQITMHEEYFNPDGTINFMANESRSFEDPLMKITGNGRFENLQRATAADLGVSSSADIGYFEAGYALSSAFGTGQEAGLGVSTSVEGTAEIGGTAGGTGEERIKTVRGEVDGFPDDEAPRIPERSGAFYKTVTADGYYDAIPMSEAGYTETGFVDKHMSSRKPIEYIDGMPSVAVRDNSYRSSSIDQKIYQQTLLENAVDPRSLEWRMQELGQNWWEPHGVYAWLLKDELLGNDPYTNRAVIADASEAYAPSERFWDNSLGSMGGELSEIMRRFIRKDDGMLKQVNPVKNMMPEWMPGADNFVDFKTGDPYGKISGGEFRLPGSGYESMNELHPDETSTMEGAFGHYGAFDRFKILADVAPYSVEYEFWKKYVEANLEDEALRKQVTKIKKEVSQRNDKRRHYEYQFEGQELAYEEVTVEGFLDDYTFVTKEHGAQAIRMAGIDARGDASGVLQQYFDVGDKIRIGIDADETRRISNDTYSTMKAVVFDGLDNLNRKIIETAQMKESETDFSATGVHARFSQDEINQGASWERFVHPQDELGLGMLIPQSFRTKFMNVRSAVEDYELSQVYGKAWKTWEGVGVDDYLGPAIDQMVANESPVASIISGGMVGGFIGRIMLGGGARTGWAAALGAAVGAAANTFGQAYEMANGKKWRPERREREDELNEYFDFLKYMKNRQLFEKGKQELKVMGFDMDEYLGERKQLEENASDRIKELEDEKQFLYQNQHTIPNWKEEQREINRLIEAEKERKRVTESSMGDSGILPFGTVDVVPEELQGAVQRVIGYKNEMESTFVGMDPFGDRLKLMRALPSKDKAYFEAFASAKQEDREKILELIPEYQRRMYQSLWKMDTDPEKSLDYYMSKYDVPDANWMGWAEDVSLDDVMLRQVMREDLDATDFGLWHGDAAGAEMAPDAARDGTIRNESGRDVHGELFRLLKAEGLQNIQILVQETSTPGMDIRLTHEEDRTQEITLGMRRELEREFG